MSKQSFQDYCNFLYAVSRNDAVDMAGQDIVLLEVFLDKLDKAHQKDKLEKQLNFVI